MRRIVLALPLAVLAFTLPPDRTYNWVPGVTVGVPGGIVNRTTIFTNLTGLDTNGLTDVTAAINAAMTACPSNQVVYIPAGTYLLTNTIAGKSYVTLRGAGMGNTVFKPTINGQYGVIGVGPTEWPRPTNGIAISSGATAGSTNVTVSSTTGVVVGKLIRVEQTNPEYVHRTSGATNHYQSSMHLVTLTNATTVTFWPPLPITLTNVPQLVVYPTYLKQGVGFEDFTVNLTNCASGAFWMQQTWGCWIKGVEVGYSDTRQMLLQGFNAGDVRDCYIHDSRSSGPNHEGLDLYEDACWNLVENNLIVAAGFPSIILGDASGGCAGNVIGYNYAADINSGSSIAGTAFSVNHGPHNMFNLFEGNVGQMFQSDGYYGSASHNTVFRNFFSGAYPAGTDLSRAVDLCHWSYWFSVVGNVLGTNDRAFTYSTEQNSYAGNSLIYRFGYPNMGNAGYTGTNYAIGDTNAAALDVNVKSNVLLVANYDYATTGIVNPTNDLPQSLYLTSKPTWFGTNAWPPIGSDLTPMVSTIPAQSLNSGITNPPTPTRAIWRDGKIRKGKL